MFKFLLRTLMILLVAGLVAGSVYALVENNLVNLPGAGHEGASFSHDLDRKAGFPPQGTLSQSDSDISQKPNRHEGDNNQAGFSLLSMVGVLMQAAKIAVITAFVLAVKGVIQTFKRRKPLRTANI